MEPLGQAAWAAAAGTLDQEYQQVVSKAVAAERSMDWGLAAALYQEARRLYPQDHRLAANAGQVHWAADQPRLALECYQAAVCLAPSDPVVLRGLGNAYVDLQRFEAADRAYSHSSSIASDPLTHWNHSQVLIGLERYQAGYDLSECRWDLSNAPMYRSAAGRWQGEAAAFHQPLRVWTEQGLGDTLQHLRWLGTLDARRAPEAPPLVLEVESVLVSLLQQGLGQLGTEPLVVPKQAEPPAIEGWHVSLLSLPHFLGGAPNPEAGCQLHSEAWRHAQARQVGRDVVKVGVVWASGQKLDEPIQCREYHRRSLNASSLERLLHGLKAAGAAVVALQFGPARGQADPWKEVVADWLPDDADFGATASMVAELDLVISVDTAMAHLVGAMGRPGWVLLPFSAAPRWLRDCTNTPWYPTLRLFRQSAPADWDALIEEVLSAFQDQFSPSSGRSSSYD